MLDINYMLDINSDMCFKFNSNSFDEQMKPYFKNSQN